MYISMTGFASVSLTGEWGTATLDVSSVNHRYQEIYVRLPRELSSWEPWFHRRLREAFCRGKLQAKLEIVPAAASQLGDINYAALAGYAERLLSLRDRLGLSEQKLALESLLTLPGVVIAPQGLAQAEDDTKQLLENLCDEAIKRWNEMRSLEGAHLEKDVAGHLERLESLQRQIASLFEQSRDAAFCAMVERVRKALERLGQPPVEESRFIQEAVIIADRWDISEELARLASHIAKFRSVGREKTNRDSVGRKLDFLVQEMNREVNTLDSKVADPEIRWLAVESKSALERIREQIQNLE